MEPQDFLCSFPLGCGVREARLETVSVLSADDCARLNPRERWDLVRSFLAGAKTASDWANDWPQSKLVKWGQPPDPVSEPAAPENHA